MTEKILARASEKFDIKPGENVWVNTDILMINYITCPGIAATFNKEFAPNAKVLFCQLCDTCQGILYIPSCFFLFGCDDWEGSKSIDGGVFCWVIILNIITTFLSNPDWRGN